MVKIRQWIARHVLRVNEIVYQLPLYVHCYIDKDDDYRGTGKTTMRMKAAIRHVQNTPDAIVAFIVSSNSRIKDIKNMLRDMDKEAWKQITVFTLREHDRQIGFRPTKIIHDLHEV